MAETPTVRVPNKNGIAKSSGLKTADAVIVAQPAILCSVMVHATTAGGKAIVYDNATAASGTILAQISVAVDEDTLIWTGEVEAKNGLYLDLTTASVVVHYKT